MIESSSTSIPERISKSELDALQRLVGEKAELHVWSLSGSYNIHQREG